MEIVLSWIVKNWLEITAVATGFIYLILSIRQNIWCWLFGIISSAIYVYIVVVHKIYADAALYFYYVVMGIYGWVHWSRLDSHTNKKELPVIRLNARSALGLLLISLILFVGIALFLIYCTDSTVPWVDAFTTALSFVATWMLARKILEHWVIWIIVDAVSVGLYFHRELYITIILYAVYTILAIYGYYEWKKEWQKNQTI